MTPNYSELMIYRIILGAILLAPFFSDISHAQGASPSDAYFLYFALNGARQPLFCLPVDSANGLPRVYGVDYDKAGRPERITQYFFGNLNTRADWTFMKFRYDRLPSGSMAVTRTWHGPSGAPLKIGVAHGETALYDSANRLIMYTLIDREGKQVEQVNAVTRSMFKINPDGTMLQEWRYSNNKQYYGSEEDIWNSQFARLDEDAWFRQFRLDENGFVLEERPLDLTRHPVHFPDGASIRRYERNSCGQVTRISFYNEGGEPTANNSGVTSIEFVYDDAGRTVEWKAYNADGEFQGRNELGGAARMLRTYRAFDGYLVEERYFDAEGEEMELSDSTGS